MAVLSEIGRNLLKIRQGRNLSLSQLSKMASISAAQLSKLENDKVRPSVATLRKLADALGVSLAVLVAEETSPRLNPVLRGEGYTFRRSTSGREPIVEVFLHMSRDARMQPEIITFPPGTDSGRPLSHDGEEFFYVLEGCVRFFYGNHPAIDLHEGDFIYFDNTVFHRYENPDREHRARLLVCCSPPVF
ncbi:MAG: cupin domain-containing protein [Thermovirga sp.]